MAQNIPVGIPQQVDLVVQVNADEVQWIQLFNGKDILASWAGTANVIGLTITAHGLSTGNTVVVQGHALNVNANGTWVITVLDDNRYTLDGSTWLTNGSDTGQAGTQVDLTGYTLTAYCKTALSATTNVFTITAQNNGTPTSGLLGLSFVAATTAAATAGKYVWYCRGAKSGANKYFAKGAMSLEFISA